MEEDLPSMRSGGEGVGAQARVHERIVGLGTSYLFSWIVIYSNFQHEVPLEMLAYSY